MTRKKRIKYWFLVVVMLLSILCQVPLDISAAEVIPSGLNPNLYLTLGEYQKDENSESVDADSFNYVGLTSSMDNRENELRTNIVNVTTRIVGGKAQRVGSAWSNQKSFNYRTKQKIGLWMKFSKSAGADGMAFVLQNDPRGINAMGGYSYNDENGVNEGPFGGQSLGVYGTNRESKEGNTGILVNTAIKNSWALEFDTELNNSKKVEIQKGSSIPGFVSNSFDVGQSGDHIAASYPGETDTYKATRDGILLPWRYYYVQNHINPQSVTLSDDQWHHVTLDWQPASNSLGTSGEMSVYFNDKNIDGTSKVVTPYQYSIDMSKLDRSETGTLRWGVTGSTSSQSDAEQSIILDSAPNLVEGQATVKLVNELTGATIVTNSEVGSNNSLNLTFTVENLNKTAGTTNNWTNLSAHIPLFEATKLVSGVVNYSDGTTEEITAAEIASAQTTGVLKHQMKNLNPDNGKATINLKLITDTFSTTNKAVSPTTATFAGDEYTTSASTPAFSIVPSNSIEIATIDQGPFALTVSDKANDVHGTFTYRDKNGTPITSGFTNGDFQVNVAVNGIKQEAYSVADNEFGKFTVAHRQFDPSLLQYGENTVTYYLSDRQGNQSNKISFKIYRVSGELQLATSAESSFEDSKITGQSQVIKRKASSETSWKIQVIDDRTTLNQKWTLQAQAAPLIDPETKRVLPGQMLYRDGSNGEGVNISQGAATIMTGKKTSYPDKVTQVGKDWQAETGIVLKVGDSAVAGKYQGDITWTIINGPK